MRSFGTQALLVVCAAAACAAGGVFAQDPQPAGTAVTPQAAARVTAAVQAAVDRHPVRNGRVGIAVRRISDGSEVFNLRGSEMFELASNAKLFTTAAALWKLGEDYEFRTTLIANGRIEAGVVQGDLVLVGGGDPSFSNRVYKDPMTVPREFAQALQKAGIQRIAGDLVMDDRLFDRVYRAPGWPRAEWVWWYAAPVSALSFNDNCVEVRAIGGAGARAPATIRTMPAFPAMRFDNQCITLAGEDRVTFERGADGATVVTGHLPAGGSRSETITVEEPQLYLAAALQAEMAKLNIRVDGQARLAKADEARQPDAAEIFSHTSKLTDSISAANKRSQNFCAEQILKTMGAKVSGKPGSFENGEAAVREFTRAAHLPDEAVTLLDGCGLSAGNRATPQAVAAMLWVMRQSKMQKAYGDSLATGGEAETTLRHRLAEPAVRGRIHAKTGTIKFGGVSTLSGYAEATDGEVYAFSILVNNASLSAALALQDAVCYALAGVAEKRK